MKSYSGEGTLAKLCNIIKSALSPLQSAVTTAQQTANTAAEAAEEAQTAADNAQSTADSAKATAEAALPTTGGTMTAPINFGEYDISVSNFSTQHTPLLYLHSDQTKLRIGTGDENTIVPVSYSSIIRGVQTPIVENDGANKGYVDSSIICSNLLDNAYFVNPVNQRGLTNYTQDGYAIDRWKIENAEIELSNNCILLKSKSADGFGDFYQIIENYNDIKGKNATFSILSDNKILEYHFTIGGQPAPVIDSQNTNIQVFSIDARHILIRTHSRDTFGMSAVKLELGSTQTLAHKEGGTWVLNEIPDYATELLKCQRYFQKLNNTYVNGCMYSATQGIVAFPIRGIRSLPTVTNLSYGNIFDSTGKNSNLTNIAMLRISAEGVVAAITANNASIGPCSIADFSADFSADL